MRVALRSVAFGVVAAAAMMSVPAQAAPETMQDSTVASIQAAPAMRRAVKLAPRRTRAAKPIVQAERVAPPLMLVGVGFGF
jgi:hypothetical protein